MRVPTTLFLVTLHGLRMLSKSSVSFRCILALDVRHSSSKSCPDYQSDADAPNPLVITKSFRLILLLVMDAEA